MNKQIDWKTWIVGDCRFLQDSRRDETIIKNWNDVVSDKDRVLIMGDFIDEKLIRNDTARVKALIDRLKGFKTIIDYDVHTATIERRLYNEVGIDDGIYTLYCFVPHKVFTTRILPNKESVEHAINLKWGATARSISGFTKPFEHSILSLSIDDWGLTPIDYNEIPHLVENMVLFDEIKEEELNDGKTMEPNGTSNNSFTDN